MNAPLIPTGAPPALPASSLRSIVTIASKSNRDVLTQSPALAHRRQRLPSFDTYVRPPSVSVVSFPQFTENGDGGKLSMVASCIPPRIGRSSRSDEGRIAVAIVYKRGKRCDVQMKYSKSDLSFKAVCIIPLQVVSFPSISSAVDSQAVLLAIDNEGELNSCDLSSQHDKSDRLLSLQGCSLRSDQNIKPVPKKQRTRKNLTGAMTVMTGLNENHSPSRSASESTAKKTEASPIVKSPYTNTSPSKSTMQSLYEKHYNKATDFLNDIKKDSSNFVEEKPSSSLRFMNTLTARLEGSHATNNAAVSNRQESTNSLSATLGSASPKKSRKRKVMKSEPESSPSNVTRGIIVVASSLNSSALPSEAPPIVIYQYLTMNAREGSNISHWYAVTSPISGLDQVHTPMKCILFASRSACRALWQSITFAIVEQSGVSSNGLEDCDEGIILMGFGDGSIRASIVYKRGSTTLDDSDKQVVNLWTTPATILLEGNGEPLLSLRLITPKSCEEEKAPILVGVGENGSVVLLLSKTEGQSQDTGRSKLLVSRQSIRCNHRFISVHVIEHEIAGNSTPSSSDVELTFLSVDDCGITFFHRVVFTLGKNKEMINLEDDRVCLPISNVVAVNGPYLYEVNHSEMSDKFSFALSRRSGDVILFELTREFKFHATKSSSRSRGLIHSYIHSTAKGSVAQSKHPRNTSGITVDEKPIHQILLKRLESAMRTSSNNAASSEASLSASLNTQQSINEIRDATSFSSYIIHNFVRNNSELPWRVKMATSSKPGAVDCTILPNEKLFTKQMLKSRNFTIHVMHSCLCSLSPSLGPDSCNEIAPVCYRRGWSDDCAHTVVLYGGTVTSYDNRVSKTMRIESMRIQIPSLRPVSMFSSFQESYRHVCDSRGWRYAKPTNLSAGCTHTIHTHGTALRQLANRIGFVIPFDIDVPYLQYLMSGNPITWKAKQSAKTGCSDLRHWQYHPTAPHLKEDYLIRQHQSMSAISKEITCCTRSVQILNSSSITELLHQNQGPGVISIEINRDSNDPEVHELCFGVGSAINLGEASALLSFIRHLIIRQLLLQRHCKDQKRNDAAEIMLLDRFHLCFTKKTLKVASHIKRSSISLFSSVQNDTTCLDETTSEAITLYEIMRTIQLIFH